jgi:hypothetical protein
MYGLEKLFEQIYYIDSYNQISINFKKIYKKLFKFL